MLPRSRVHSTPAGKAPQRGADAVKACYLLWGRLAALRDRATSSNLPALALQTVYDFGRHIFKFDKRQKPSELVQRNSSNVAAATQEYLASSVLQIGKANAVIELPPNFTALPDDFCKRSVRPQGDGPTGSWRLVRSGKLVCVGSDAFDKWQASGVSSRSLSRRPKRRQNLLPAGTPSRLASAKDCRVSCSDWQVFDLLLVPVGESQN
jgi:hypothetical protein